jgi:hypothetical protein
MGADGLEIQAERLIHEQAQPLADVVQTIWDTKNGDRVFYAILLS